MDPRWQHPHGLRPTIRHLMILVIHVALLSALAASLLRGDPSPDAYLAASVLVPLSFPMLALLVLALDRPGPAKSWLVGLLVHLTIPATLAWTVGLMLGIARLAGRSVPIWLLVPLVGFAVISLVRVSRWRPRRCPACGVRAFLPVGRITWCAACGHVQRPQSPDGPSPSIRDSARPPGRCPSH